MSRPTFHSIADLGADAFAAFVNACNIGLDGRLSGAERHDVIRLIAREWVRQSDPYQTEHEEDVRERALSDDADFEAFLASIDDDEDDAPAADATRSIDEVVITTIDAITKPFRQDDFADYDKHWTYASAGRAGGEVEIEAGDIIRVNWTELNGGPAIARVTELLSKNLMAGAAVRVEQSDAHHLGNNAGQGYIVYPNMSFEGKLWGEYLTYDFDAPTSELDRLYGDMEPQAF